MPAHIKPRGSIFYLIDGPVRKSLDTDKKGLANYRLEQYIKGKFGLGPKVTVKGYYERWIETKREPMVRRSTIKDYSQHFTSYILPAFSQNQIISISIASLETLRASLVHRGLALKTCRNIIDSSFRAMWRDAMRDGLVSHNPFELLEWPRTVQERPDPFTALERDKIVAHFADTDFFYYPYVFVLFSLGMRPSELAALRWPDVDMDAGTISITKSRNMGADGAPKTAGSNRIISMLTDEVREAFRILPSRAIGCKFVFVNKVGDPMTKKWAAHHWGRALRALDIRHRKFYSTRHTFITERIRSGESPLAVAQHCGTSLDKIQANYCGRLGLTRTITVQQPANLLENKATLPGEPPLAESSRKDLQRLAEQGFDAWKRAKSA